MFFRCDFILPNKKLFQVFLSLRPPPLFLERGEEALVPFRHTRENSPKKRLPEHRGKTCFEIKIDDDHHRLGDSPFLLLLFACAHTLPFAAIAPSFSARIRARVTA